MGFPTVPEPTVDWLGRPVIVRICGACGKPIGHYARTYGGRGAPPICLAWAGLIVAGLFHYWGMS